jgi:GMP synthase (glutamine-hydrolysing)
MARMWPKFWLRRKPPAQMPQLDALLIQIRTPGDPMIAHERSCVRRRLERRRVRLHVLNALEAVPTRGWLRGMDAVVIGGSGDYSVHDPRSVRWVTALREVLDAALERGMPGFGVCFGHQLLGYHLGQPVNTDENHAELGTVEVELTGAGREDPLFRRLSVRFDVHTGHSDHVDGVPEGVELMARNDRLQTQAFKVRGKRFYSTQFHPDMTGEEAHDRYHAYQASLRLASATHTVPSAAFQMGSDESVALLGLFFELLEL